MRESELLEGNRFLGGFKKIHDRLLAIVRLYDQLRPAHVQNASALVRHWPARGGNHCVEPWSQPASQGVFKSAQPRLRLHSCLHNFCGADIVGVSIESLIVVPLVEPVVPSWLRV